MVAKTVSAQRGQSFLLRVRVQPRASRTETSGVMADGSIKVKVKAAPVRGEANQELVSFLAARLGIGRSSIKIVSGHAARNKTLRIEGIDLAGAMALLREV